MYIAPLSFDKDDKPDKMGTSKRSFCTECSSMLWNYHDEFPDVRPSNLFLTPPSHPPFHGADEGWYSGSTLSHLPLTSRIPSRRYRLEFRSSRSSAKTALVMFRCRRARRRIRSMGRWTGLR